MRLVFAVVFALVLGLTSGIAHAGKTETVQAKGTGTFRQASAKSKISRVEIEFRDEDKFTMTVTLDDDSTVELRGRYDSDGRRRDLEIRKGLGRDEIKGTGDVSLADNSRKIRKVSVLGKAGGEAYSIEFEAKSDSENQNPGNKFTFSGSADGDGRVTRGDDTKRFSTARVKMSRTGDFSLTAVGESSDVGSWEGEWWGEGPDYRVDLRQHGDVTIKASGTIRLTKDRKRIRSLDISGTTDAKNFAVKFEASSDAGEGGDSGSGSFPLSRTVDVEGTLQRSGQKIKMSQVKFLMGKDGAFEVTLKGKGVRDEVWKGQWSGEGPEYTILIRKTEALKMDSSGTIVLSKDRKTFKRLDIAGHLNDSPFSLSVKRPGD